MSGSDRQKEQLLDGRFRLTNHCCRYCMGRILERNGLFVCSCCEVHTSLKPDSICGCGMRSPLGHPVGHPLKNAYHCGINPHKGPLSLARIVILFGDHEAIPLDRTGTDRI